GYPESGVSSPGCQLEAARRPTGGPTPRPRGQIPRWPRSTNRRRNGMRSPRRQMATCRPSRHRTAGRRTRNQETTMPAYIIVETDVHDPEQYERYKQATPAAVAAGGGRFLVRGGELSVLEGDWQPKRLVVLEFEDLAAAERF